MHVHDASMHYLQPTNPCDQIIILYVSFRASYIRAPAIAGMEPLKGALINLILRGQIREELVSKIN